MSERQDLNLRPPRPERGALPDCATLRYQASWYSAFREGMLSGGGPDL